MSDTDAATTIDPAQQRAFEDWLDATYGSIAIFESSYRASEVLQRIDPIAYQDAFMRFVDEGPAADAALFAEQARLEALKRTVRDRFPLPVAHCFYRYEKGARYATQQLTFLRDTWEAVIFLLYALVVGEFRAAGGSLAGTRISARQIFSDKVNDKLTLIRQLLGLGMTQGLDLACSRIIGPDTLQRLEELNHVRNDFSHNGTLSDKQVRAIVARHETPVLTLLQEIAAMQDVRLLRYVGSTGSYYRIQHQLFTGHNISQSFDTLELPARKMADFGPYLDDAKILAYSAANQRLFSLAPFVHFVDDDTDKWTKLCFYKQRKTSPNGRLLIFEVVGDSIKLEADEAQFHDDLAQLDTLLATAATAGAGTP
jgi:hypothetical protein